MTTKKTRVLLNVDYLTKKVLDVSPYFGDGKGVSYKVDDVGFLQKAEERGCDVYYVGRKLVERPKKEDFYVQKLNLEKDLKKCKKLEQLALMDYIKNGYRTEDKDKLVSISSKKSEVKASLNSLAEERSRLIRQRIKNKLKRANFKYYASICLIIRNDHEYFEEWLNWHVAQGIEHFYVYDHSSVPSIKEFSTTLPEYLQEKLTVIDFSGSHDFAQHEAYNHCLKKYGKESRWIGYIDSDEMVRVIDGTDIKAFLKDFEDNAGLFVGWKTYGANGQKHKSSLPVRQRFPKESEFNNQCGVGKVFVQPYFMRQMLTHNGYPVDGYKVVDENKNPVEAGGAWQKDLTTDKICIDHYYTKSYEEWLEKISRGTCDPYFNRKYEEFFLFNPDLLELKEENFPIQVYEERNKQQKTKKN